MEKIYTTAVKDVKDYLEGKEYKLHVPTNVVKAGFTCYYKSLGNHIATILVGNSEVAVNLWDLSSIMTKDNPTCVKYDVEDFGNSVHVIQSSVDDWIAGGVKFD